MTATTGRIAVNVFRESVRDKVLYNLVAFAVLMIGASILIGQLSAGQEVKIIKDLGLASMSVFGLFMAVFIGIGLVAKEVERRSIYALLAKPITRTQLVLGKYAGLVLTLVVNLTIMTVAFYAVLAWMDWQAPDALRRSWEAPALDPALLKAIWLILVQLMIVTAVALLFSTFSSPLLSAALTFGLYVIGHFNADLRNFESVVSSRAVAWMARGLYYLLPNFAPLDVKAQVVHGTPVPWGYLALTTGYAGLYIAALLTLAAWIFSRRDFK
jgi:ABC-type transport system involved in multi-copper enzyme maturation permease subunit